MKKRITISIFSIIAASLLFAAYQPSDAVTYYGHDGSIDKTMKKVAVDPIKGKSGLWNYTVKICANDYPMAIHSVKLKSDTEQIVLGFNKTLKKGDCTYAASVMKAKDGKTLGAELIQKHEAVEKMLQLGKDMSKMSQKQKQSTLKEIIQLYMSTGLMPRF